MLFTHRGLSGPAILQISSYWQPGQEISIDLLPGLDAVQFLKERRHARPKAELRTLLAEVMPQRLAEVMATADTTSLNDWRITPTGTEGYAKAEVTVGGIDTDGLSSKTMEARRVPGLYVIGEAVDVTGWLGGYNFQWAWSSGWAAGDAA
jgi:predicted Rossmann fold flavoprotein